MFSENQVILNPGKCNYMLFMRSKPEKCIGNGSLDNNLKFDGHIKSLCGKVTRKLRALSRINKYLTCDQKFVFVNFVVKSQFNIFL